MTTDPPIVCSYCFGPIHGEPQYRNGRPYHQPNAAVAASDCSLADREVVPDDQKPVLVVHADQLALGDDPA